MNYATWEKYKAALANETWTAWGRWPADVQDAMLEVDGRARMVLSSYGEWRSECIERFLAGNSYRVNPSWPGPAKPVPVVEYEDCKVECKLDSHHYMFARDGGAIRSIVIAPADPRFAGYVMPGGPLEQCLIFDQQTDGTWRLRVPLAVRLRKEVVR